MTLVSLIQPIHRALAVGSPPPEVSFPTVINCQYLDCVVGNIITALLWFAAPIATLMILVGAFQIMTAAGNKEKLAQGRKTVTYAIVGFVVLILAQGIRFILQDLFH